MYKAFLDTNILIDVAVKDRQHNKEASDMLLFCSENRIQLATSIASICTLCYILEKNGQSHQSVKKWVLSLLEFVEIIPTTNQILSEAMKSEMKDSEDAILFYTAVYSEINLFVTRNIQDFTEKHDKMKVILPEHIVGS